MSRKRKQTGQSVLHEAQLQSIIDAIRDSKKSSTEILSLIVATISCFVAIAAVIVSYLQSSRQQVIDIKPAIDITTTTQSSRDGYIGYWYDTVRPVSNDYKFVVSDGERDGSVRLKKLTVGNSGKELKEYEIEIVPYFKFIERTHDEVGEAKYTAYYFPIIERENFFDIVYHPPSSKVLIEIEDTAKSIACYNKLEHTSDDTIGFRTFLDDLYGYYREYCECSPCHCYYCECDKDHYSCTCGLAFDENGEYYFEEAECCCYGDEVELDESEADFEVMDNLQIHAMDRLFLESDSPDLSDFDYYTRQTYYSIIDALYPEPQLNTEDYSKSIRPGIEKISFEYFIDISYIDVLGNSYQELYSVDTGYGGREGKAAVKVERIEEGNVKEYIYKRMLSWDFKAGYFIHNFPKVLREVMREGRSIVSTSDANYLMLEGKDLKEELMNY